MTAAVLWGLTGCAIEGPPPEERESDPTVDGGAVVGDPVATPGTTLVDPAEEEPGPDQIQPVDPGDEPPADPPPSDPTSEVCYAGADGPVCLPVVTMDASFPAAYDYPFSSQAAYTAPVRFLDLQAVAEDTMLAPNFALGELMQSYKGRYAIFQPHVVDKLQSMRDQTGGAVVVHSAYRSPGYNAGVGGATFSRHMYGDGVDMHSAVVSLNALKARCQDQGADFVSVYATHVHCDWRYSSLEPAFFANGATPMVQGDVEATAEEGGEAVVSAEGGTWFADADGFDEGEPYREWSAFDARGRRLETVAGESYQPPAGAAEVEVVIGGRLALRADVDRPWAARPTAARQLRLDTLSRPFEAHHDH